MTGQKRARDTNENIKGKTCEAPIALQADRPPIRNDDNAYRCRCNETAGNASAETNQSKTSKSEPSNGRFLPIRGGSGTSIEGNTATGKPAVDLEELNFVIHQSIIRAVQYPFFWATLPEEYAERRRCPMDCMSLKKPRTGVKGVRKKATNRRTIQTQPGEDYMGGKHEDGDEVTAFEVWYKTLDG